MKPRSRATATAALLTLVSATALAGCGSDDSSGKVSVMASFYPLVFIAERVGGDHVTVSSLTPPGAEPHDVELSPSQVDSLGRADVGIYLSGFQAAVDEAFSSAPPKTAIDVASSVDLQPAGEALAAEEEAEEGHADDEHAEDEHGSLDPHFWLDPERMVAATQQVADAMAKADPDGAADYRKNADALVADLTTLDNDYSTTLAHCERTELVTAHAAFGYLAAAFGLTQVGISGIDPESEPSPSRLAEVSTIVKRDGVTTIFFESLVSPKVAKALADDLGITAAKLDPIEAQTDKADDYIAVSRQNLEALDTALSCS